MRSLILVLFACSISFMATAQKDESVIRGDKPITWLGMDFTKAKYIGQATQFKDAGEVTDDQMRDKYIPAWNELFINEEKKYDVASYVNRSFVSYALDITSRANNKIRGHIFSEDPGDFQRMDERDIALLVSRYDFMGKTGIGMIFFIEGMSKGRAEVAAWVTFIDMGRKTVVQTQRITGKASGFGFRNYWAKGFLNILKEVKSDMR